MAIGMPKAKKRKRSAGRAANEKRRENAQMTRDMPASAVRNPVLAMRGQSMQNVVFSTMIGLGCWGMAFFFAFLYADPNHYLYGGIMALTALGWSVIAARKWSIYRQRA